MARKKKPSCWPTLAKEYLGRTCTQDEFCKRHGVNPSTLQYHVSRLRKRQESFLPVELAQEPEQREVTVEFPSGLLLSIRG